MNFNGRIVGEMKEIRCKEMVIYKLLLVNKILPFQEVLHCIITNVPFSFLLLSWALSKYTVHWNNYLNITSKHFGRYIPLKILMES